MQPDEEFQPIQLIEIHLILNRLVGDHVAALDFGCDVLRCTRLSRRRAGLPQFVGIFVPAAE
jgi:hypothetical protein